MAKNKRDRDLSALVKSMAALGIDHALIAKRVGLTLDQLEAQFSHELKTGPLEMNAFVGASLFQQALSGVVVAQIFWLKTRAGWSETVRREISGPGGGPIEIAASNPRVRVIMPCNKRNPCPRKTSERSIRILEEILRDLIDKKALPG